MKIKFEKWHGCQNDFIILWQHQPDALFVQSLLKNTPKICHRRNGIGADGILLFTEIKTEIDEEYPMMIINADGSLAKNCGNGLRCAALSILKKVREKKNITEKLSQIAIRVDSHLFHCRVLPQSKRLHDDLGESFPLVSVQMESILMSDEHKNFIEKKIDELGFKKIIAESYFVQIKNPHLVFFLHDWPENNIEILKKLGKELQQSPFWDGINVHLVTENYSWNTKTTEKCISQLGEPIAQFLKASSWERGVGLTPACGSGASAIAQCVFSQGFVEKKSWIAIEMPGGWLYLKSEDRNVEGYSGVQLVGPGQFVYSGELEI